MVLHSVTKSSIRILQILTDFHFDFKRLYEWASTGSSTCTSNQQENNNKSQNHYRKTHYNPGQVKESMCLLMVKLTMNSLKTRMWVSLYPTKNESFAYPTKNNRKNDEDDERTAEKTRK